MGYMLLRYLEEWKVGSAKDIRERTLQVNPKEEEKINWAIEQYYSR